MAQTLGANQEDLLASVTQMRVHDDRIDFLVGIDLILAGLMFAPLSRP